MKSDILQLLHEVSRCVFLYYLAWGSLNFSVLMYFISSRKSQPLSFQIFASNKSNRKPFKAAREKRYYLKA